MTPAVTPPVWPESLTPELREVLGFMCFQLGGPAHVYQRAGEFVGADGVELGRRAEDEQAFMLHKLVGYALRHGAEWSTHFNADIKRALKLAAAAPHAAKEPSEPP